MIIAPGDRRRAYLPCLTALVLSLAACGGTSSGPKAGGTASSHGGTASSQSPTPAPPTAASASLAPNGHCVITPGATAAATVTWDPEVGGGNPRIKAGQAVAFVTDGYVGPTVTEGTNGTAVTAPCIDEVLAYNTPVVVTFRKRGVYHLFCRKRPAMMFTSVYVT